MVNGSVQMVTSGVRREGGRGAGQAEPGPAAASACRGNPGEAATEEGRAGPGQTGQAGRFGSEHRPPRDAHVREALGGRRGSGG